MTSSAHGARRTGRRTGVRGVATSLLTLAVLATGCGVDAQAEPETIPAGGLPSDLRPTGEPTAQP